MGRGFQEMNPVASEAYKVAGDGVKGLSEGRLTGPYVVNRQKGVVGVYIKF